MKKIICMLLLFSAVITAVFSADQWWEGKTITGFDKQGNKNVSSYEIDNILYQFRGTALTEDVISEMEAKLLAVEGIDSVSFGALEGNTADEVRVYIGITEKYFIDAVNVKGQSKVRKSSILDSFGEISVGTFLKQTPESAVETMKTAVENLYRSKGFGLIPVTVTHTINSKQNTVTFDIEVVEGIQTRVNAIYFEGNENVSASTLKKNIVSKTVSLFNQGFYSESNLQEDIAAIENYYRTVGFVDAQVTDTKVEEIDSKNERFRDVTLTFFISEHEKWNYEGMDITGNEIYSDDDFASVMTLTEGSVLNLDLVSRQFSSIQDVYYDNGYITSQITIQEERHSATHSILFHVYVTEGPQAVIEKIIISGLGKTKEHVMKREISMKEGDVFSKSKLQTSAQNLYNTGLLSNLDYRIYQGEKENGVILEFVLEEGKQMDIQFGATFGGTVNGFPISGFLQWADRNLGGQGQDLSVSTTLSPDVQTVALSFADSWFRDKRWSNSLSLSFTHTKYKDELQKGTGSSQYNGWNDGSAWPYGYTDYEEWKNNSFRNPSEEYLMDYSQYNINLGWTTGYMFIFNTGRLSVSGGLGIGLNKVDYDEEKFIPYEALISRYRESFQFSNKISLGIQWDGRDYITNTTKGYILSSNVTYAGGILQGLSNYVKTSVSAAGYLKLLTVGKEDEKKNIMFSASTSFNFMLPQLYVNNDDVSNPGFGFHDAKLGAGKYEMLYIDGITIARGHSVVTGQAFMWDSMLEITYPISENILNLEAFASLTALSPSLSEMFSPDWYFSVGTGFRLKITGFPLGLYLVKNAVKKQNSSFEWLKGTVFGGMNLVLAISTSII